MARLPPLDILASMMTALRLTCDPPFLSQIPFSPQGDGLHGSWVQPVYGSPSYPGGQLHTALFPVDLH